ncbi:hypothetical protein LINGRAHAP2_LOCUS4381 [Linum grandiflorum]
MIILSWNCQGLGRSRAVTVLSELVNTHRPGVVILLETLVNKSTMEEIRVELNFGGCFVVDAVGHSGGVCILWQEADEVRVLEFGRTLITVELTEHGVSPFVLTGYYRYPQRNQRKDVWNLLRTIARPHNEAWCCMGDFNDLLAISEKQGLRGHPETLM